MPPEPIRRSKAVPAVEQLSDAVVGGHGATYFATPWREVGLNHARGNGRGDGAAELGRALDDDRNGDLGRLRGCESDEPGVVQAGDSSLGGPRLAGDRQVSDVRRLPRALLHHAAHHPGQLRRCLRGHHALELLGMVLEHRLAARARPPGATIHGRIRTPPLAIVATTSAICIGVASSRSWPIATRPMSSGVLCGRTPCRPYRPLRRHLVARVVERRLLEEPEALHRRLQPRLADLLADLREHRVVREGQGVGQRDHAGDLAAGVAQRRGPATVMQLPPPSIVVVGRELAALQRRRRRHDLEGRARARRGPGWRG